MISQLQAVQMRDLGVMGSKMEFKNLIYLISSGVGANLTYGGRTGVVG